MKFYLLKRGDYIPTSVRFSVSDNLNEVCMIFLEVIISLFQIYLAVNLSINFLTKNNEYSVLGTNVLLNISFCKNRVTEC